MSLSFKTVNLLASAASILTKEQIDAVLYPVTIVLTEEAVLAEDTGPVMESTAETTGSAPSLNDDVFISDGTPTITEDDVISRGPWGDITVRDLEKEIIDSFREGTYANPEVGGGKLSFEVQSSGLGAGSGFGGDDSNQEVPNDNAPAI